MSSERKTRFAKNPVGESRKVKIARFRHESSYENQYTRGDGSDGLETPKEPVKNIDAFVKTPNRPPETALALAPVG